MGSDSFPSLIATVWALLCFLPWLLLVWIALRDKTPGQKQPKAYREIRQRHMADERAGFVEAKMQKIERAMK